MAAVALTALAASAASAAPCPQSCASNTFEGDVCTTLASRDHTMSNPCPLGGVVSTHERWDLVLGTIAVNAQSCASAPSNGFASILAHDRFRLVGPAGGAPIVFQAKLRTSGSAGGFGTVSALVGEVAGDYRSVNDAGLGGFDTELVLPLAHAIGEEFELVYEVHASAEFTAQAQGTLSFSGLPPGYGVTSCQGFAGDGAVAVRRSTWGAIKNIYR